MSDEKHSPLFSIIVPVYNVEKYLRKCIDSVLSQTVEDYELILVDDGSTDRSGEICREYAEKVDRIKFIGKENGGPSTAKNCGIKNARGKFLLFLDSDDFLSGNDCLSKLKTAAQKSCDIVLFKAAKYFDGRIIDSYGDYDLKTVNEKSSTEIFRYMVKEHKQLASACNKMVRRDYVLKNGIFFLEDTVGEDIDWSIRLFENAENICAINEILYMYRQNRSGSMTNTLSPYKINSLFNMIKNVSDRHKRGNSNFDVAVKSFMAYEFAIFLYIYPACNSDIRLSDIKEYKWLLRYAIDGRSKIIRAIYGIFGYDIGISITKILRKIRER